MHVRVKTKILASTLLLLSIVCCGGTTGDNNVNSAHSAAVNLPANATRTNAEELRMVINIPYDAEESVWRMNAKQNKLIAVLRFSAADSDKITADSLGFRTPESVTIPSETWFPEELTAQSEISGDDTLKGVSYGANLFFQDSFNEGRAIRIEGTNYFVLEMTSK